MLPYDFCRCYGFVPDEKICTAREGCARYTDPGGDLTPYTWHLCQTPEKEAFIETTVSE